MSTQQLLEAITRTVALSPALRAAFLQVDRALFVPEYYRQSGATWTLEPGGLEVYEDRALVTQLTNGLPSSSSSQPSIMALMLEALDVHPGQRVLEIGTGTGYNAALLAFLVKAHGQVISLDIDAELIRRAKKHIERAGLQTGVTLVQADGRKGEAQASPFDRILLTAGVRALEPAWIHQLQRGGGIVGNLRGRLSSVLFSFHKEDQHAMSGRLLSQGAHFMEIHGNVYPTIQAPDWQRYDQVPMEPKEPDGDLLKALEQQAFLFFLQGQQPQMQLHLRAFGTPEHYECGTVFLLEESTAVIHQNGMVEVRGEVWERITRAYECYRTLGAPTLKDYRLFALSEPHRPRISAHIYDEQWPVCSVS